MRQFSSISFKIADITLAIISADPALKLQIQEASQNFIIPRGIPDVTIESRWGDLSKRLEGKKIFDSGALWRLYESNGKYLFSLTSNVFGSIPYKMVLVKKDFSKGEVLLHSPYFNPNQPVNPLEYPLDELLFINFLALGKGVEIHACGVVDSLGRGHLFVGQSGAGKSTIARLWENESGITVLSDDRIILRKMENTIWMYGTPWHGEAGLASPARAPLTRAYFLQKGQKHELISQSPANSVGRLFACCFPPFYNREALNFTLGFHKSVVKDVPCYELDFTPDKGVVEFIQSL